MVSTMYVIQTIRGDEKNIIYERFIKLPSIQRNRFVIESRMDFDTLACSHRFWHIFANTQHLRH